VPRILGVDPGGTTGFCLVESEAIGRPTGHRIIAVGEILSNDFFYWLQQWDSQELTHVVCEDWIQRPDMASGRWTPQSVAKQVGAISYRAFDLNCLYIELQPSDKPTGYKAAGLRYIKGKRGTHIEDATAHALFVAKLGFKPSQRKG